MWLAVPSFRYVPQEESQPILLLQVKAILGKLYFILSLYNILFKTILYKTWTIKVRLRTMNSRNSLKQW
jgi:hypothetical protein